MKILNKVTNELWECDNLNDTLVIEGKEYIKVYIFDKHYPNLMRKDLFTQVITNEQQYENRNQLNG